MVNPCKNCKNKCCDNITVISKSFTELFDTIPKEINEVNIEGIPLKRKNNNKWKCKFYKHGRCSIYKIRPTVCKYWTCRKFNKKSRSDFPKGYMDTNLFRVAFKTKSEVV